MNNIVLRSADGKWLYVNGSIYEISRIIAITVDEEDETIDIHYNLDDCFINNFKSVSDCRDVGEEIFRLIYNRYQEENEDG